MFGIRAAAATRGAEDRFNEDNFLLADDIALYAVCDGWGDHPGGEIAAYLALEAIEVSVTQSGDYAPREPWQPGRASTRLAEAAVRAALERVVTVASERPDLAGMGTTVTLLLMGREHAFIAHHGDSRAYLVRSGRLVQLTTDQAWTSSEAEAAESAIESFSVETAPGDTFLLCTDGAEREVANPDLVDGLEGYSPPLIASRIVSAANRRDPTVDATVVVVRVRDEGPFAWAAAPVPSRPGEEARALVIDDGRERPETPYTLSFPRRAAAARAGRGGDGSDAPRSRTAIE